MKVVSGIFGIVALALLMVFLGKYAVSIGSLPLWIIIVGVLILPVVDFVQTLRQPQLGSDAEQPGVGSERDKAHRRGRAGEM